MLAAISWPLYDVHVQYNVVCFGPAGQRTPCYSINTLAVMADNQLGCEQMIVL